jgi:6-pyruvoyltetrahydropterin/6-carboxytetrahydropterin synthase
MPPTRSTVSLTRAYRFSAAHYYYDETMTAAENEQRFGACARRPGHGHDYRVEVTLGAAITPATGMVYDVRALDGIVQETVLTPLDYRHLNHDVPYFAGRLPTTENLALFVWEQLAARLPAGILDRVRVYENADLFAEYRGVSG